MVKTPSAFSKGWMKGRVAGVPLSSPFSNFLTFQETFEQYHKEKKFPFAPFAIFVKVRLFYGCQKLWQTKSTQNVPFKPTLSLNEWIEFGDFRVDSPTHRLVLPAAEECPTVL